MTEHSWECEGCDEISPAKDWTIPQEAGSGNGYIACPKCGKENQASATVIASTHEARGEPTRTPLTRETLLGRVADVLRRSGVEDAEDLIAELEKQISPEGVAWKRHPMGGGWRMYVAGDFSSDWHDGVLNGPPRLPCRDCGKSDLLCQCPEATLDDLRAMGPIDFDDDLPD